MQHHITTYQRHFNNVAVFSQSQSIQLGSVVTPRYNLLGPHMNLESAICIVQQQVVSKSIESVCESVKGGEM